MYKKFILTSNELINIKNQNSHWDNLVSIGSNRLKEIQKSIIDDLNEFTDLDGELQAEKIINNWFPNIDADIFISHSHKDNELILGLSGWLKEEFGLTTFIDSVVWGYSDDLLRIIDDRYCRNSYGNTYNYLKRNRSTSHVHMMLSTALMNMIDKCEVFIFIETENSFIPSKYLKSKGYTESTWIYSELSLVDKIRRNIPERIKNDISHIPIMESLEDFKIKYNAKISNLETLTYNDLNRWKETINTSDKTEYKLDKLYRLKEGG